jgi:hypothetical protein
VQPDTRFDIKWIQRGIAATKSRFFATLRSAPAAAGHVILSEAKDLLFFAPREEVENQCYSAAPWPQPK